MKYWHKWDRLLNNGGELECQAVAAVSEQMPVVPPHNVSPTAKYQTRHGHNV